MEKAMKVFLTCALGAFIGSMAAFQFNHYLWWLGLIIGGFMGYISYEFKKVIAVMPKAWESAKRGKGLLLDFDYEGLKDVGVFFGKGLVLFLAMIFCLTVAGLCFCFNVTFISSLFFSKFSILADIKYLLSNFTIATMGLVFLSSCLMGLILLGLICFELGSDKNFSAKHTAVIVITPVVSPILFTFFIILYVIYKLTPIIIELVKRLFVLIHSDARLLCATDAAIGTAIGYFSGSAIIGALAGGVFGIIDYLVISVRIFKLNHV